MKKIYFAHSTGFDYKNELYKPIRESTLNKEYYFLLPHEKSDAPFNSKEFFKNEANLIIAEISYPSTGMGIELGWADSLGLPIIEIAKKNTKYSSSPTVIAKEVIEYENSKDLIEKLTIVLKNINLLKWFLWKKYF